MTLQFGNNLIGIRFNYAEGISNSESYQRYDRQIGNHVYRIMRHWYWSSKPTDPTKRGIKVYVIGPGPNDVTLVKSFGRPLPAPRW